jgi:NAD(P)H-hydrate repair Nnr-like enzyme with NAD(P)H-hydrate epimerase domain
LNAHEIQIMNTLKTKSKTSASHTWVVLAEQLNGSGHFLLADLVILALLGVGLQTLPRQRAAIEVHEHETKRLEIITATLL